MQKRSLGNRGLEVPALGWLYGMSQSYRTAPDKLEMIAFIRAAVEAGSLFLIRQRLTARSKTKNWWAKHSSLCAARWSSPPSSGMILTLSRKRGREVKQPAEPNLC